MEPEKKSGLNWTKILLVLSLCLNLLIISAVATAFYGRKHSDHPAMHRVGQIEAMLRSLPEEKRKELRQEFRFKNGGPEKRTQSRELRKAVTEAMFADPFDEEALRSAFGAQRAFRDAQAARTEALWIKTFTSLSDEDRARFETRYREILETRGERKKKH